MRGTDGLFERLRAAIDGGDRLDMSVRELRACANVLEMHVAEQTPDPEIVNDLRCLLMKLALLRRLPEDRQRQVDAVLQEIQELAFP